MQDDIQDIIQIGLGPVGLTAAAVIGQSGHTITAVERHDGLYGLPRAGHIDHEIVRILQSLDAEGPVLDDSYPTLEYVWVNNAGETLLEFDWGAKGVSGYNSDYMQYQPVLEDALSNRALHDVNVTLMRGWEAVGLAQHEDHVELTIHRTDTEVGDSRSATNAESVLRGRYLIAADGASSGVRKWLGIERDDLEFNERWLVVDARKKHDISFDFDCGQICDPARPRTVLPLGKRHRRWEWCLLPGERNEDFERPEKAWELLAGFGVGPDDVEIVRQLVYTFEARTAVRWREGRVFLIGDAAHTMPPFMGQGMCSGMRDAKNLAWKLDLVLRGLVSDGLLDTYAEELRPYVLDWTVISLEAGKVPCITDFQAAAERDELFRKGFQPPMPDFPKVRHGAIAHDQGRRLAALAGDLGPQARVDRDGRVDMFDRAFNAGGRWQVLSVAGDPREYLTAKQIRAFESLGTVFAYVAPAGSEGGDAIDVDGSYQQYFGERGIEVLIARPDFYIFGAGVSLADLSGLTDQLFDAIGLHLNQELLAR